MASRQNYFLYDRKCNTIKFKFSDNPHFSTAMSSQSLSHSEELFEPRHPKSKAKLYHRWTLEENSRYITFLQLAREDFEEEYTRRIRKVFKRLSEFMESKSESQCKSHHQKMLKQHGTIDQVIKVITKKVEAEAKSQAIQQRQKAKFKNECRRRIRKVFKKLAEYMKSHDPQKSLKQQIFLLKVFSELSKAIEIRAQSYDTQQKSNMQISRDAQNYLYQEVLDKQIFDVLNF